MTPRTGTVTAFSVAGGLGEVTGADGGVLPFHCTAIADGTRDIPVGAAVAFELRAGHHGRWEAVGLVRIGDAGP